MNYSSPLKLRKLLFKQLKLPVIKTTKTGASTADNVLQQLKNKHPLIPLLIKHRELNKLLNTYTKKWVDKIHPIDDRVHAEILMVGTPTGRISMRNPNPQQLPNKVENASIIRKGIIAEPGNVLIESDFSQMDLRILAHCSHDKELCKAFNENIDIHNHTATLIFNKSSNLVTTKERFISKKLNFGIIYGMQAKRLAEELNISEQEAQEFITRYFNRYWGVRQWQRRVSLECQKNGYVETFLGFRRYLPNINSRNPYKKMAAERMAWSAICSGGTANVLEIAMIKLAKQLPPALKMIVPIHDSLVFECTKGVNQWQKGDERTYALFIKETMENAVQLDVPIKCNVKVGQNLSEMREV